MQAHISKTNPTLTKACTDYLYHAETFEKPIMKIKVTFFANKPKTFTLWKCKIRNGFCLHTQLCFWGVQNSVKSVLMEWMMMIFLNFSILHTFWDSCHNFMWSLETVCFISSVTTFCLFFFNEKFINIFLCIQKNRNINVNSVISMSNRFLIISRYKVEFLLIFS